MSIKFRKPKLHWHGWKALLPYALSCDEDLHRAHVIGWTFTGRICIFTSKPCNNRECYDEHMAKPAPNRIEDW